jgi:2-C-methyl-D-erythritol 4-phosphate cytidylyltransferase
MKYTALVTAAGKGSRTRLDYNKVFYHLDACHTVLDASLSLFLEDEDCTQIIITSAHHEMEEVKAMYANQPKIEVTAGGDTRQESVRKGLDLVKEAFVFIHDGARPNLGQEELDDLKKALKTEQAALLMVPSTDTVKLIEGDYVAKTLNRRQVWNAQTPQAFSTDLIRKCHAQALQAGKEATDDAQLVEWFGHVPVRVVHGSTKNRKITMPEDLRLDD